MEKLKEYLKENLTTDDLKEMVRSVNSYNCKLDYLDYYENEEYFLQMFFEGRIDDRNYNYTDEYVHFNACGNLISCNEQKYNAEVESYTDEIIDNYLEIYEDNKEHFKWDKCYKLIEQYEEEQESEV